MNRVKALLASLIHGRLLNCILVAAWLWIKRPRDFFAVRRSRWFSGLIPHAANIRANGRFAWVMEYIPRRERQGEQKPDDDSVALFNGRYRVRIFRRVADQRADTFKAALEAARREAKKC